MDASRRISNKLINKSRLDATVSKLKDSSVPFKVTIIGTVPHPAERSVINLRELTFEGKTVREVYEFDAVENAHKVKSELIKQA